MTEYHLLNQPWKVFTETADNLLASGVTLDELLAIIPSVEEFWGCFEAMGDFSEMKTGTELYFLKGDNRVADNYRKVVLYFPTTNKDAFNASWLRVLLVCMGESVVYTEQIRGVLFSCRQYFKVTVFLSRSCDDVVPKAVALFMKELISAYPEVKICYSKPQGGFITLTD
ncbi:hypothetical protein EIN_359890 [Entamoeba invadens IP1]|uniref:Uncharacterized protein n=1 Tax=Entamoeba invadens IP1 TaxID=370355 RepID=A0A0A1UBB0_ENTIV|nr:hypothetical protein EIN_359890 [Entamoeba invadens IP1]ELP90896.1 hypothetical protein EIN_359890 [Entamoeba invadens IP1]|eukprot:XP_004257667.1 hypothetical protein EIN_359890 [Entamoeba invadens IP1]